MDLSGMISGYNANEDINMPPASVSLASIGRIGPAATIE